MPFLVLQNDINDILLVYKYHLYKSSNSESISFICLKNNNLKINISEEMLVGNVLRGRTLIKNGRLSAIPI